MEEKLEYIKKERKWHAKIISILVLAMVVYVVVQVGYTVAVRQTDSINQFCADNPNITTSGELTINCTEWNRQTDPEVFR